MRYPRATTKQYLWGKVCCFNQRNTEQLLHIMYNAGAVHAYTATVHTVINFMINNMSGVLAWLKPSSIAACFTEILNYTPPKMAETSNNVIPSAWVSDSSTQKLMQWRIYHHHATWGSCYIKLFSTPLCDQSSYSRSVHSKGSHCTTPGECIRERLVGKICSPVQ